MIIGIYLAAGQSKRMGRNKLELPLSGESLGTIALKTILQTDLDYTIVITNPADKLTWIPSTLVNTTMWRSYPCLEANNGQSYSLKCGVKKAKELGADAAMVFLADQPFISREIVNQLISIFKSNMELDIVTASFNHIPRPPVLFAKNIFPEIMRLQGDQGARELVRGKENGKRKIIECTDRLQFLDIDQVNDYLSIRNLVNKNKSGRGTN